MRSVTNLDWVTCLAVTKVVFVHEGGRTGAVSSQYWGGKAKGDDGEDDELHDVCVVRRAIEESAGLVSGRRWESSDDRRDRVTGMKLS